MNPLDSTELESFGSTETNNLNTSVDIIINDTFFLQGYNNSQIYDKIIQNLLQVFAGDKDKKILIKGKDNFMFELTTQENELEILSMKGVSIRRDLSVIDLGECINLLKNKYYPNRNDDISFIILKHEKITNISSEKIIQYEVYDPFDYRKLDISICQNVSIDIHIPIHINEKTKKLIEDLEALGYNVFNINDPFYQDFCTKYTTEGGTDISLEDRKKYIYESIMDEIQCQEGCEFSNFDSENKNLECSCKVIESITTTNYKKFSMKKLPNTFYDTLKYSNYKVLKCYKLVFNKDIFKKNKGFWFLFILFILYLTQLSIYISKKINPFKLDIARYHFKINLNKNKKEEIGDYEVITEKKEISSVPQFPPIKKRNANNSLNYPTKIYEGGNTDKNILNQNSKENNSRKSLNNDDDIKKNDEIKLQVKNENLEDFELNNLEYENALKLDKRNFFRIYWSILKREHIIIFTFFFHNDYNFYYVKFEKFIFLLATDMAMNVFFFSDETMNKLYLSYGKYDFVQNIPQIIYSKLVSNIIEVF